MKHRVRKIEKRSDVIVVHMGDDVLDVLALDAKECESLMRLPHQRALALGGHSCIEAGVDKDHALLVAHQPHEIIHRHRRIVRVAADKVVGAAGVALRVPDGKNFIGWNVHRTLSWAAVMPGLFMQAQAALKETMRVRGRLFPGGLRGE